MNIREQYTIKEFENNFYFLLRKVNKKKDKPVIVIQGGYGKKNTGDDALLLVISQKVLQVIPNARIIAICHGPDNVVKDYGIEAYHFKSIKVLKVLFKMDMIIIGGGGIVNIINTFSGRRVLRFLDPKGKFLFLTTLLAKIRRKTAVFYVVGMTSIPDVVVGVLIKLTLPHVDLLGVRDQRSLKLLEKMKINRHIYLCHDPALDLDEIDKSEIQKELDYYKIDPKMKIVFLNVRLVLDKKINDNSLNVFSSFIEDVNRLYPKTQIVFLPISMHEYKDVENDLCFCNMLINKLGYKPKNLIVINKYLHPKKTKALLSIGDLLILTRLHAVVLSCEYEIPTCIVSYDAKVQEFGKMAGLEKNIVRLSDVSVNVLLKYL